MILTKDGQVVDLSNENHINAFLSSGWVEAQTSAPSQKAEDEVVEVTPEPKPEPKKKAETKKPVTKKKQEK